MDSPEQQISFGFPNLAGSLAAPTSRGRSRVLGVMLLFWFYKAAVGPALRAFGGLGFSCRFYPSCSEYAADSFLHLSFLKALRLSLYRVCRCNPWNHGPCFDLPVKEI